MSELEEKAASSLRRSIFAGSPRGAAGRITRAVKAFLDDNTAAPGSALIVACSGGADSLILAASLAYLAPQRGYRLIGLSIDHSWRAAAAEETRKVARQLTQWGYEKTEIVKVYPEGPSPEGAARTARYQVFAQVAAKYGVPGKTSFVLLGHTRDDQAESLLLGLGRGSGLASLQGMTKARGMYLRPLLDIPRADTLQACLDAGLDYVDDPSNYPDGSVRTAAGNPLPRALLRHEIIPALSKALGQDVRINLAKTAQQMQADQQALLLWAEQLWQERVQEVCREEQESELGEQESAALSEKALPLAGLALLPEAPLTRTDTSSLPEVPLLIEAPLSLSEKLPLPETSSLLKTPLLPKKPLLPGQMSGGKSRQMSAKMRGQIEVLRVQVAGIAQVPVAVRMRLWRKAVLALGASDLKQAQLEQVDELAIHCLENGPIYFGGKVKAYRPSGTKQLLFYR